MEYRAVARDHADAEEPFMAEAYRPVPADEGLFSPLEEQVIALACADSLASLEPPGLLRRLLALLFGLHRTGRALADARLEILRRAVVVSRHRHHLPDLQAAELRQAGFTPAQVRAVERKAAAG